jgi:hypothetical protein
LTYRGPGSATEVSCRFLSMVVTEEKPDRPDVIVQLCCLSNNFRFSD